MTKDEFISRQLDLPSDWNKNLWEGFGVLKDRIVELRETTKTGAIRIEDFTTRVAKAMLEVGKMPQSKHGWVFYHNDKGSHYDNKKLNQIWRDACGIVGVEIGLYEAVRHSLGCQLADAGYSLDFIQDIYKHTSIKTTRRYAKRNRSMISDALENRGTVIPITRKVRNEN